MRSLALFDFDGTLTTRDTFLDFHRFFWGSRFFWGFLALPVAAVRGSLSLRLGRDSLKEAFLTRLWKGVPLEEYLAGALRYAENRVEGFLAPLPVSVFLRHVERGHDVYVVTASLKDWIEPWASKYGVPVVGTEMESEDGILTGRMRGANCRGAEKARRIAEAVDLRGYDKIYAYGNSVGDREMLLLADEKVYNWDHVPMF
ncbi:MAG: HAD-IB family hydrolase [Synergistaceae bacterium]|nr:HAD-IB family hydrolase [Synergistaceae bacterium]